MLARVEARCQRKSDKSGACTRQDGQGGAMETSCEHAEGAVEAENGKEGDDVW